MEDRIGRAAGKLWKLLDSRIVVPKSKLPTATGLSQDLTNQALGWLAREGKVYEERLKGTAYVGLVRNTRCMLNPDLRSNG